MDIIIFILVALIVLALLLWATEKLPMIDGRVKMLIQALLIVLAAVVIARRAGML